MIHFQIPQQWNDIILYNPISDFSVSVGLIKTCTKANIQIHSTYILNFVCVIFINKLLVNENKMSSYIILLYQAKMCIMHKTAKTIAQYTKKETNFTRGLKYITLFVIWSHKLTVFTMQITISCIPMCLYPHI